jgi:NADPH:quinone reductase-like Zn-dependent oxidoreductase
MGSKKYGVNPFDRNLMEDYTFLAELFEANKVAPVIDKVYPLSEVSEGLRHLEEGLALGKVVISME